jgi:dihydroflavonol-4-reductase
MKSRSKAVLVTGASGFIGSAVAARFSAAGYAVRCLLRKTSDNRRVEIADGNAMVHIGDISEEESLVEAMKGCDAAVNCAGLNSFWEKDRSRYRTVNIEGTRNVMEAALQAGVKKTVHISTAMAYGFPDEPVFNEESGPGPHMSEYARSKYEGDRIAWELYREKALPLTVLYLAAVLGKGDKKSVMQVRRFVEHKIPVMIDSDYRFTYVYMGDVAEAVLRALEKDDVTGERYLIGKERFSTREYFQIVSEITGVQMPNRTIGRTQALFLAAVLTALSSVTGKRPLMPIDLMRTVYRGSVLFDGSKAELELGISYTKIRFALQERVDELMGKNDF